MNTRVAILPKESCDKQLLERASECERRFGVSFGSVAYFSRDFLTYLHLPVENNDCVARNSLCVLRMSQEILNQVTQIANRKMLTDQGRKRYLDIFLRVYRQMPFHESSMMKTLTVAPRREGMLLASKLGWLTNGAYTPHLKRIPFGQDLAVGVEYLPTVSERPYFCRIVDGAIASGATIISVMEMFYESVDSFEVYTVHCTQESLNALFRYAQILNKKLVVYAGFVHGALNGKFYAVAEHNASAMIVGDVGDMISPLFDVG